MDMDVKLKSRGILWDNRNEEKVKIENLIFKEDVLNPEQEKLAVYYRGDYASGIIELSLEEAEAVAEAVSRRKQVVQSVKILPTNLFEPGEYEKSNIGKGKKKNLKKKSKRKRL